MRVTARYSDLGREGIDNRYAKASLNTAVTELTITPSTASGQYTVEHRVQVGDSFAVAHDNVSVLLNTTPTPPTASDVLISGTAEVGQVLTGSYTYADAEGDLQGASTFRWLRDNVAIAGATTQSYALVAADQGAMIGFEVTPVAQSGTSGLPVVSAAVGPIAAASCPKTALNVSAASSDGGFAYIIVRSLGTPADNGTRSGLKLFENGLELGPAHSIHANIRNLGLGRFSHWSQTNGTGEALRFAASDNTDPRTNGRSYTYCVAGVVASCTQTALNVSAASSDGGFAYIIVRSLGTPADNGTRSGLKLFENGLELGPAHFLHRDIRNLGRGRFSHWSSTTGAWGSLRFAASDNTDPRTNGRCYTYCVP